MDPPLRLREHQHISETEPRQDILGEIHNLEAFGADHSQLVFKEVHVECFRRDEKVLVQAEPLGPLAEERTKGAPLTILGISSQDRLQNSE